MTRWELWLSGLMAGLGIAMPLGAIGVLLVVEGVNRGFRRGAPGAIAVASVDASYGALAILGGAAAAPVIRSWGPWPANVGGLVLLVLAGSGLRRRPVAEQPTISHSVARFGLFFGLTAINPATLLYFGAIAVGLGAGLDSAAGPVAFVLGVAIGSLVWQLGLVAVGARFGERFGPIARRRLTLCGNLMVGLLGLLLIGSAWLRPG